MCVCVCGALWVNYMQGFSIFFHGLSETGDNVLRMCLPIGTVDIPETEREEEGAEGERQSK